MVLLTMTGNSPVTILMMMLTDTSLGVVVIILPFELIARTPGGLT